MPIAKSSRALRLVERMLRKKVQQKPININTCPTQPELPFRQRLSMKYYAVVLLFLSAAFLCSPSLAKAQQRGETQIVQEVLTNLPSWRNTSNGINIGELQVPYQAGKLLEQNLSALNQDLATSQLVSNRILAHRRLSDQILLMGLLGNLSSDIYELQGNLMDFAPTVFHNAKYQTWSERANNAVKQTNSLAIEQMNYVTARADQMESSGCK